MNKPGPQKPANRGSGLQEWTRDAACDETESGSWHFFLSLPYRALPKGRPRFRKAGAFVRTYTDAKTRKYEERVRAEAVLIMSESNRSPSLGPLSVIINARFKPPKSWSKKKQQKAVAGEIPHMTKPDVDNVQKAILDALEGPVYANDKQVVRATVQKGYALEDGVDIIVKEEA